MVRINSIGVDLQDETKKMSRDNKVLSFHFFGKCPKCKTEKELTESMFTDSCEDKKYNHSFTGWQYKCNCGHCVQIWEGAFDSAIESFYDNGLVDDSCYDF